MDGLRVDTLALHDTARQLTAVSAAAHDLADGHLRAAQLCWACGLDEPTESVDAFLNRWAYGVRWIAAQSEQLARDLTTSALTFEAAEAALARAAAGGDGGSVAPVIAPRPAAPVETPVPMTRRFTPGMTPPVQLAHATRVEEILPGNPDQVALMARLVTDFAEAAHEARQALQRSRLGGWTGAAAQAAEHEMVQLNDHLTKAEGAFDEAGEALAAYARAHAQARDEAARALVLWQSAAPAAAIAHGTAVGVMPADAPSDPDAVLARAAAMAQDARAYLVTAGRALHRVLDEAKEGAPKDPGLFGHIRRAVASFALGVGKGTEEMVVGTAGLAKDLGELAYKLNPLRPYYDPDGYNATMDALWTGVAFAVRHPKMLGAAMANSKEFHEDPAKWAGEWLPDILGIVETGGATAFAKEAETVERIETGAEAIKAAEDAGTSLHKVLDPEDVREILRSRDLDPSSVIGKAVRSDLEPPFGGVDDWQAARLAKGQYIAVVDGGRVVVPFDGELTKDGVRFYKGLQMSGKRVILSDGSVGAPQLPAEAEIYRVTSDSGVDVAEAVAHANPQYGEGGATRLFVNGGDLGDRARFEHVETHSFDTETLKTKYEDPDYRAVDPAYQGLDAHEPVRALDPGLAKREGFAEGVKEKAVETARETAFKTTVVAAAGAIDRSSE